MKTKEEFNASKVMQGCVANGGKKLGNGKSAWKKRASRSLDLVELIKGSIIEFPELANVDDFLTVNKINGREFPVVATIVYPNETATEGEDFLFTPGYFERSLQGVKLIDPEDDSKGYESNGEARVKAQGAPVQAYQSKGDSYESLKAMLAGGTKIKVAETHDVTTFAFGTRKEAVTRTVYDFDYVK